MAKSGFGFQKEGSAIPGRRGEACLHRVLPIHEQVNRSRSVVRAKDRRSCGSRATPEAQFVLWVNCNPLTHLADFQNSAQPIRADEH